jgi:hypothetical protein
MAGSEIGRLALVWRGDQDARRQSTAANNRWREIFAALAADGIHAEPAVYCEEATDEVRDQLLHMDGVLVWVDPLSDGRDRRMLDAMLRDVASRGVWVSTHPDVIAKMGVKEVLHATRHLGWGADTHLYRTLDALRDGLLQHLRAGEARVIKRNRGNGGQGVWKVALDAPSVVKVQEARRGSAPQRMPFDQFMEICAAYFVDDGCIIDQPFQQRLSDGMIRCYLACDKVVGFGHQFITALLPTASPPGPRIMHPATAPEFGALKAKMEVEWAPSMMRVLGIERDALPIIWDADFLYGSRSESGEDTYVLCEINVSSVFPLPDQAATEIARVVRERLMR